MIRILTVLWLLADIALMANTALAGCGMLTTASQDMDVKA
jgi:hypothetical protein